MMGKFFVVIFIASFLTTIIVKGASFSDTKTIYDNVFNGYNKVLRPVLDQTQTVSVSFTFFLISIDDFDEVSGTLKLMAVVVESWKDENIVWDPSSGVESLVVPQDDVWHPNLFNTKVANNFLPLGDKSFTIRYYSDGTALWMPGGFMSVKCSPDVTKFPFDIQKCPIHFLPWGYFTPEVTLVPAQTTVDLTYYETSGEWELVEHNVTAFPDEFSFIHVNLKIKRLPMFHILNTLLPIALLSIVTPMVFLLPCDSGERSGYSLTMLLSATVFLTSVQEVLPATSEPMSVLSYFVFGMLVFGTLINVINVVQLYFFFKDEKANVPEILQVFVKCLACRCTSKTKIASEQLTPLEGSERTLTWQDVVRILDRFYLIFFLGAIVITTCIFFAFLAMNS